MDTTLHESPSENQPPIVTTLRTLGMQRLASGLTLIDAEALDRIDDTSPLSDLALMVSALHSPAVNATRQSVRLSEVVRRSLDMDMEEASVARALADPSSAPMERTAVAFHRVLLETLCQLRLHRLFCGSTAGEHHRSVCPTAYDERTGDIHAEGMAQWRADFRGMSTEQQMVAATIVWLYRSGPDSTWLRRVPCTWGAVDALRHLRDTGCVSLWLQLIVTYPGW